MHRIFILHHLYIGKSTFWNTVHQALVLQPSRFPEKVGKNQNGINQKQYSHNK